MAEYLCLTDLLDSDLTSYEYFCSLPENVKKAVEEEDVRTFEEMQSVARQKRELPSDAVDVFI